MGVTVREDLVEAHRLAWEHVASPGSWWPAAARVETHVTVKDGDIVRMREVKGYDVPANGKLELKPGGAHLMFVDIRQPFRDGEKIPATLWFEKAGEVKLEFQVGRPDTSGGHKH